MATKFSVHSELSSFRAQLPKEKLKEWEQPEGWVAIRKIAQDWTMMLLSHGIFVRKPCVPTFIAAACLMALGQRGIACIGHDSIHGNIVSDKVRAFSNTQHVTGLSHKVTSNLQRLNDAITNVFLAPPLLSTARTQRSQHSAHHHYLGSGADPDHGQSNATSLRHYRLGKMKQMSMFELFLLDVFDIRYWWRQSIADLKDAPLPLLAWWAVAWVFSRFLPEPDRSISRIGPFHISSFVVLFHVSRCTVSYCCYVFRELVDHAGLDPTGGILHFSRTTPRGSLFQAYFQPHDDNYHLLHHILPRIPMSRLYLAHEWLLANSPNYANAEHYEQYFEGKRGLFSEQLFSYNQEELQKIEHEADVRDSMSLTFGVVG